MSKPAFRIKLYAHPRLKFVVRSKLTGKWQRKFFETEREAKTYVEQQEIELLNHGREGTGFPGWLRVMAQHGQKRLGDAVDFYVAHLERTKRSVPLDQATREMIAGREASGASETYCYDLKLRLGRFCKDFAGRNSAEITTADVDDWLGGAPTRAADPQCVSQGRAHALLILPDPWLLRGESRSCNAKGEARRW